MYVSMTQRPDLRAATPNSSSDPDCSAYSIGDVYVDDEVGTYDGVGRHSFSLQIHLGDADMISFSADEVRLIVEVARAGGML